MKLKLAAALVAGTAAITMLAGCPTGTPNVTPATPFAFNPNAVLQGEVTFAGQPLGEFADWTPRLDVKQPGGNRLGIFANVEQNRYFQFVPPSQNLTEGQAYQVIWDYAGATPSVAADFNTIDVYVSDPATASVANTPEVKFDVQWNVNPSPTLNATASPTVAKPMTFSFNAIPNLNADYQVSVFAASGGSALWSSATLPTATSVTWTGKAGTGANPGGNQLAAGNYTWNVKFWRKGGTFGGANFHGETLRFPFTIQ